MKRYILLCIFGLSAILTSRAQGGGNFNAIKLFISDQTIATDNAALPQNLQNRLYRKITQLINETGIAEIGYSTFLVAPKIDILSVNFTEAGISKVYLAQCELGISIKRTTVGTSGEATFSSFSKTITGSGTTKDEAIANALNNLSVNDREIVAFLNNSKAKIDSYFKTDCDEVIKKAAQALALKNYEGSIALYFSVPSSAPCYTAAVKASQKVYSTYVEDLCNKRLVKLKAYVALAQTQNTENKNYYDSALSIMSNLSPSSDKCYVESMKEIEKIEIRLGEEQKRQWELAKKLSGDEAEVKKEMYKAMGAISSNYQQNPATNVIIAR